MKQTLIWFNLQGDGTGNGFSNIKGTFAESLQLQISAKYMYLQGWSLKLSDDQAKYKEKVLDGSDSNHDFETTCNSKLKFTGLKDLFMKRVPKSK